jgi:ketosteroid isomerase-like protein
MEHGTYAFSVTPPGGPAMNMTGKYMARWTRMTGGWVMTHDIWNDDAPMAPPPPAPARRRP